MSQHTPKPWEIDRRPEKHSRGALIRHNGIIIARLVEGDSKLPGEHYANGRLIVGAPKLLKACMEAEINLSRIIAAAGDLANKNWQNLLTSLRDSIAEAQGDEVRS